MPIFNSDDLALARQRVKDNPRAAEMLAAMRAHQTRQFRRDQSEG